MKRILSYITTCLLILAGCTEQETFEKTVRDADALAFATAIGKATKASEFSNTSWNQNDALNIHAYSNQPAGWSPFFNQDIKFDGLSWSLQGEPRYRSPYKSRFISVYPASINAQYNDNLVDFVDNFPTLNINAADYTGSYLPDLIASTTDVLEMETNVNLAYYHLLSQVNIGVSEFKDAKITIKDIKFVNVPAQATYTFQPGTSGEIGSWGSLSNPVTVPYLFSLNNSFTTTGNPESGSYIFGDGGNFSTGETYKYVYSDGATYTKNTLPGKLNNSLMLYPDFSSTGTTIEFTYSATDMNGNPIGTYTNVKGTIDPSVLGTLWKQNYRYLYMINFDFSNNKLTYNVTVNEWENYNLAGADDGSIDTPNAPGEVASLYINPDDPNLTHNGDGTATYVIPIDKLPVDPNKTFALNLLFANKSDLFYNGEIITLVIPTSLPANITEINIDIHMAKSDLSFIINNQIFSGTISFIDYFGNGNTSPLGSLDIFLPNGSVKIGEYTINGNVNITTALSTFFLSENALVKGDLSINGGRAIIDGKINGIIFAKGNAQVNIKSNNDYKKYWTASITHNTTSSWYGFGASMSDLTNLAAPGISLPNFLNMSLGLHFAGAYANFNFNNNQNGLNWNELRNVRYDFFSGMQTNPVAQATLKNELHIDFPSPAAMTNTLNAPMISLQEKLKSQVAQVELIANKYAEALPGSMKARLAGQVSQMKAAVDFFCNRIPTASLPSIPNLPIATYIPASDNIELNSISSFIGKPEDKFELLRIMDYVNGARPVTLFMLVNFFNDFNNAEANVADIQAEIDRLKGENTLIQNQLNNMKTSAQYIDLTNQLNTLVFEYDGLAKPELGGLNGGVWVIIPAVKNLLFETVGNYFTNQWSISRGNPDQTNRNKLSACNTKINEIETVLAARKNLTKTLQDQINANNLIIASKSLELVGAEGSKDVLDVALKQIGITPEMIKVIIAIAPYLESTANVLSSVNSAIVTAQSYNPWAYPLKASSKTSINSMAVDAKFEYAPSMFIHVIK